MTTEYDPLNENIAATEIIKIEHYFDEYLGIIRKYTPDLCQKLIEHGRQGFFIEGFAGKHNVCVDKICDWLSSDDSRFDDFKSAYKISISACIHCINESLNHMIEIQNWVAVAALKSILADFMRSMPKQLREGLFDNFTPESADEKAKKKQRQSQDEEIDLLSGRRKS